MNTHDDSDALAPQRAAPGDDTAPAGGLPIASSRAPALGTARRHLVLGLAIGAVAPVFATALTAWWMRSADWIVAGSVVAAVSITTSLLLWTRIVRGSVQALDRAETYVRKLQHMDPLTGLLNRSGLHRYLDRLPAGRVRDCTGVLIIDLDRFNMLNASLGPRQGDELLRLLARRLHSVLPPQDVAARLSGDVFAIVSVQLVGEQAAQALATNLLRAIEAEVRVDERDARVSASIGIALMTPDVLGTDDLLARAEAALRVAKTSGGASFRVFDTTMLVDMQQRLNLEVALRQAVQAQSFRLEFQPIVDARASDPRHSTKPLESNALDERGIHAVEALLRWQMPGQGPVSPARFIPVLEETGLIVPVGLWVLREACKRAQGWVEQGAAPFVLSVNVSPIQFAEPDFVPQVLAALDATGWPADLLQLEVTEGLLMDPSAELKAKLEALIEPGIKLALDDFGMGYSSLAYLKRFKLHTVKIDRMFVIEVPELAKDTAIVRAMVELAHALGLHVTVEGIETRTQSEALAKLGCDSMQGYLFARPMAPEAVLQRLLAARPVIAAREPQRDWSTTMGMEIETLLGR